MELLTLGYPDDAGVKKKKRLDMDEIVMFEQWTHQTGE